MENSQNAKEDKLSKNKEKGEMAEKSFANFLNDKNIPYFYIDQGWKTFSKVFDINRFKRPDYIIYTENLG